METGTQQIEAIKKPQEKPNNAIVIPVDFSDGFFKQWCLIMRTVCKLSDRETEVTACFLKYRYLLSKSISDPALVDTMLMTKETRQKVMRDCGISQQNLYVIMGNLIKRGVFTKKGINPLLIPNFTNNEYLQLVFLFENTTAE